MIANFGGRRLLTPSIPLSESGNGWTMQRFTAWSARTTSATLQNGADSPTWKRWFVLLFLTEAASDQATSIPLFAGKSIFLRRKSERELPLVDRFSISYRRQWKKLFAAKNFTWSNGNNARTPS